MKSFVLSCLVCLLCISSTAQWSTDPTVNTFVAGTDRDHTFPKIVASPEGSFYISSWKIVGSPDYYHLWLQRLDYDGNPLWGADGIEITNQRSRTWLSDYALALDPDGNAIIALEDMRGGFGGHSHVSVYCVAPDGHAVWDTNGIQLTNDLFDAYSPTICLTHANNILVAWNAVVDSKDTNTGSFIKIQKLSPAGTPLWANPITIAGPDSNYIFPSLLPVAQDDFIMVWQKKFTLGTGMGTEWYTYLYAMRYGEDGNPKWTQPSKICDHADTAYVMPEFQLLYPLQGNREEIYVTWFDYRYNADFSNIYLQCVDTTGKLSYIQNGIPVSNVDVLYDRVDPRGIYDNSDESVAIFWEEVRTESGFDSFGIVGQKVEFTGNLQWGSDGKIFAGFKLDTIFYIFSVQQTDNRESILLIDEQYDSITGPDTLLYDQLYATRIDTAGNQTWSPPNVMMASTEGTKFYPGMSALAVDIFVVTWAENRTSPFNPDGSIYAQDISQKGNLGPDAIPEVQGAGEQLSVYPNPTYDKSTLVFHQPVTGKVDIAVLTPFGQMVKTYRFYPDSGIREMTLSSSDLPTGLYLIRAHYDDQEVSVKWMVIR